MEKTKKNDEGKKPDWLDLIAKPMPKFDPKKDVLKILTKSKQKKPKKQMFLGTENIPGFLVKQNKQKRMYKKARYILSGGAVILNVQKNTPYYLLVQYPTYWGFVKGEVEPGETEEETVYRETFEEVGISDLQIIPKFRETQQFYFKIKNEVIRKEAVYFLARTHTWIVKLSHEHLNFKWVTYEDAIKLMTVKGTKDLLKKAHERVLKYYKLKG